ncbi:MAG: hypothetical protein U0704_17010 [Candidatus Eisenbacteria bacterium]
MPAFVRRLAILSAAVTLLAVRAPLARAVDLSVPDRAIEGIWRLDPKKSDDPAKAMPRGGPGGPGMRGGLGGPGGMGGPPMGGGMGPGRHEGRPDGGPGEGPGEDYPVDEEGAEGDGATPRAPRVDPMRRILHPAEQVVIFVLSENVEISEDERPPLTFALQDSLDAHGRVQEIPGPVARWKQASLVTRLPLGRSGMLTETYEFSADGRTLTVRAKSDGGPPGAPTIQLKRVYTRYDGE